MKIPFLAQPKISIVTITYNNAGELPATIESVLAQTYPDLEYIVIDGASKDKSAQIVRSYQDRIAHWVSEPDKSRYDAMNKGAAAATGEWVLFMNAGDVFSDKDVVTDMFRQPQEDADLLYGHVLRRYPAEGIERFVRARSADALPLQMPCCHQSLFTRHTLLVRHPFMAEFPISSDHEFLLWAKNSGARFKRQDRVVSIFTKGGVSDEERLSGLKELLAILRLHRALTPGIALKFALFLLRSLLGPLAKKVLPPPVTRWLLLRKTFD
jgi:glycosyltransferase involved in cell wall biosynthesis